MEAYQNWELDVEGHTAVLTLNRPDNANNISPETLYELRKHKGLTLDHARDTMADVSYFGTMMVYKGKADGMVSGAAHSTLHTIRPAFQFVKAKPGFSVVSSSILKSVL